MAKNIIVDPQVAEDVHHKIYSMYTKRCKTVLKGAAERELTLGKYLYEAKLAGRKARHGKSRCADKGGKFWCKWVEEDLHMNLRTAQRYCHTYKYWKVDRVKKNLPEATDKVLHAVRTTKLSLLMTLGRKDPSTRVGWKSFDVEDGNIILHKIGEEGEDIAVPVTDVSIVELRQLSRQSNGRSSSSSVGGDTVLENAKEGTSAQERKIAELEGAVANECRQKECAQRDLATAKTENSKLRQQVQALTRTVAALGGNVASPQVSEVVIYNADGDRFAPVAQDGLGLNG